MNNHTSNVSHSFRTAARAAFHVSLVFGLALSAPNGRAGAQEAQTSQADVNWFTEFGKDNRELELGIILFTVGAVVGNIVQTSGSFLTLGGSEADDPVAWQRPQGGRSAHPITGLLNVRATTDAAICSSMDFTQAPLDESDPAFPDPDPMFLSIDLPLTASGAHDLSVELEVTLEDTNGDGIAYVRPTSTSILTAAVFDSRLLNLSSALAVGTIEAPGTYVLQSVGGGGVIGRGGELHVTSSVNVSPGDRVIYRLRAIVDDGGLPTPSCVIPPIDTCVSGNLGLCMQKDQFAADVVVRPPGELASYGAGVLGGSADTGLFWFFDPNNWEVMLKVLDGCAINGHYWVLLSAVTDVAFDVTIYDLETGRTKEISNRQGQAAEATIDTSAFPCGAARRSAALTDEAAGGGRPRARRALTPPAAGVELAARRRSTGAVSEVSDLHPAASGLASSAQAATACQTDSQTLCLLQDGYEIEVTWRDFQGNTGSGRVAPLGSADSGIFYFFDRNNWEMLVKVLDGCGVNGKVWVFAAATTDVEYTLTVTNTDTGEQKTYFNPLGTAAPAITDTSAFAACT